MVRLGEGRARPPAVASEITSSGRRTKLAPPEAGPHEALLVFHHPVSILKRVCPKLAGSGHDARQQSSPWVTEGVAYNEEP